MQGLKTLDTAARLAAAVATIAIVTGCARQSRMPAMQQGAPIAAAEAAPARARLTDANIGALVVALNNTDISYARLVSSRAQSADVKAFAQQMLADHGAVSELVTGLYGRLGVSIEDDELSLDLRDESADNRDVLRELSGATFDSAYVSNEVRYHKKFLALLDDQMLEDSDHGDVRQFLAKLRPAVAAHLAHAERLQASMAAGRGK